MPPKRKNDVKATLRRVENGLRRLFRGRDHPPPRPPATESKPESNVYLDHTDWSGLERFSGILERNSGAFGPLTSAIGRFSECIEMFEKRARAPEEYKKLGSDLNDIFHALAGHFERTDPASITLDSFGKLAQWVVRMDIRLRFN
ncbi:hypothetical protein FRC10_009645 [Ceratobasidium sp. 414]|nr:hypothetical protein FRC10_009645 [Ceratobasidium sp. 414]